MTSLTIVFSIISIYNGVGCDKDENYKVFYEQ